jgi:hypothetical protein
MKATALARYTKKKHAGETVTPEWYAPLCATFLKLCFIRLRNETRNETFDFPVGPTTSKLHVSVFDHKTLGKDKCLGGAEVDGNLMQVDYLIDQSFKV